MCSKSALIFFSFLSVLTVWGYYYYTVRAARLEREERILSCMNSIFGLFNNTAVNNGGSTTYRNVLSGKFRVGFDLPCLPSDESDHPSKSLECIYDMDHFEKHGEPMDEVLCRLKPEVPGMLQCTLVPQLWEGYPPEDCFLCPVEGDNPLQPSTQCKGFESFDGLYGSYWSSVHMESFQALSLFTGRRKGVKTDM